MIVEEGYGDGDPRVRLAQLSEAMLRDLPLHRRHQAALGRLDRRAGEEEFFVEQGYIEPETAFQEARRGTYNPTYLYYTLGKLQIYKLREDVRKAQGAAFSLQKFHDDFVRQGGIAAEANAPRAAARRQIAEPLIVSRTRKRRGTVID